MPEDLSINQRILLIPQELKSCDPGVIGKALLQINHINLLAQAIRKPKPASGMYRHRIADMGSMISETDRFVESDTQRKVKCHSVYLPRDFGYEIIRSTNIFVQTNAPRQFVGGQEARTLYLKTLGLHIISKHDLVSNITLFSIIDQLHTRTMGTFPMSPAEVSTFIPEPWRPFMMQYEATNLEVGVPFPLSQAPGHRDP